MSLSVVIPVYNEEGIIEKIVRNIYKEIISKVPDSEFIIINDCSTDKTPIILKKLSKGLKKIRVITPSRNSGHGKSIRLGFMNAKKGWVFQMDSDGQFDPKDYWKLDRFKGKYDYTYGYRIKRHDPMHRKIITSTIRIFNLIFFGTFIKDSNSGFKLIRNKALKQIIRMIPEDAFAPTIMITLLARKLGYRIKLVGITHQHRKTGKASSRGWKLLKVCFRGAKELFRFRMKMFKIPEKEFKLAHKIVLEAGNP
jgi:glycosyltransferase involved in cell wall biosynthesis